jgi:hypothetical protein
MDDTVPTIREAARERRTGLDDDRVLSKRQWCELNGFSIWTGERLLRSGKGPVITQISDRRVGITVRANRAWQQARERV